MSIKVSGYIPKLYNVGKKCGDDVLAKRTIQIDEELITPKKCKKMCDDEIECKYFFIQYNPAESVTTCETFKTCDVAVQSNTIGATYEKLAGN